MISSIWKKLWNMKEGFPVVVANVLDYGIVVSKFELQSRYYISFRTITTGKGMKPLIPPAMG